MGQPDPYKLAAEMPASTFADWQAYYMIEPFGQWRDDYHAATISAILANVNRGKGKEAYSVSDFMWLDEETRRELDEEKDRQQMMQFISGLQAKAEGQQRERERVKRGSGKAEKKKARGRDAQSAV